MHRLAFLTPLLLIAIIAMPEAARAASPASVSVRVAPENPSPKETVTITVGSYANDLNSVSISWSVNGKTSASGIGLKSFSLQAPEAGSETRVAASIAFPDGAVEKTILIRPAVMALLWQANDSYVPPFYKGKALPTQGSEIKIVALPEIKSGGQTAHPRNLVYAWKKDYTNDPNASGYGKNFYIFTHDYLDEWNDISVTASTTDQKYSSGGSIGIRTFDPKILFYRQDSGLGTRWEYALPSGYKIASEEILEAAPYFISPKDIRIPSLTWDWSINGTYINNVGIRKNVLPVRTQSGNSGISRIKLEINNKYKLFAVAAKEISVEF